MQIHKTPDHCFENLEDFPFTPNFVEVDDLDGGRLNIHYVDEGPKDGQPVVMIHGNPTWSFMWRKIIPVLADAGYRAIAIDLVGMGRSDKPTKMQDYSVARHVQWVTEAVFTKLAVTNAHFVLHDWGGIIGLRAIADHQDQVASITFSNTGFPTLDPNAKVTKMARSGAGMLRAFQLYVRFNRGWKHWKILARLLKKKPSLGVIEGYSAPYPEKKYLTGNRQFTQLLPTRNDNPQLHDNWYALEKLKSFKKPFLCLFSDKDQIAPKGHQSVRDYIVGAKQREPVIIKGGSHFLLEDVPEEYGQQLLKFLNSQR